MGFSQVNWTDAEVEELKRLWATDDSATVIGVAMGKTRNAILGKVHRLGLEFRTARNGSFYKPPSYRSIFKSREKKPRRPKEKSAPAVVQAFSPVTGAFVNARKRPHQREFSKNELRAQLTQAVLNTARMA